MCALQTSTVMAPMAIDLDSLVPLPAFSTHCGMGAGLAVCPILRLIAAYDAKDSTLSIFALPDTATALASLIRVGGGDARSGATGGLAVVHKTAPSWGMFSPSYGHGALAFTGPESARRLLVADHRAVHVMRMPSVAHGGYVAAPGTLARPQGVAARGTLVAVSVWDSYQAGDHAVHLFEGDWATGTWSPVRILAGGFGRPGHAAGQLSSPRGLRLSADGSTVAVVEAGNHRVSLFRVEDGSLVRQAATGPGPRDVEVCEGGWMVACYEEDAVEYLGVGDDGGATGRGRLGGSGVDKVLSTPVAVAVVPGLGLLVREYTTNRLQLFADRDAVAMASMSAHRVGWMVAVVLAALQRNQRHPAS